jgi:hypothetical protein
MISMRFQAEGRCARRLKFVCDLWRTSSPHLAASRASQDPPYLAATSKNRAFCDGNTTSDNFFRSLRLDAPQLSQFFFTKQECTQDPVPMHEWLGSQIPDTAPYIEWLAIVCSVMALLFAQSYSHMAS